jgi:hypothetical protein
VKPRQLHIDLARRWLVRETYEVNGKTVYKTTLRQQADPRLEAARRAPAELRVGVRCRKRDARKAQGRRHEQGLCHSWLAEVFDTVCGPLWLAHVYKADPGDLRILFRGSPFLQPDPYQRVEPTWRADWAFVDDLKDSGITSLEVNCKHQRHGPESVPVRELEQALIAARDKGEVFLLDIPLSTPLPR